MRRDDTPISAILAIVAIVSAALTYVAMAADRCVALPTVPSSACCWSRLSPATKAWAHTH
ncbi:MAG: hypothetical protein WA903_02330 [Ornithinimicrobium sp.]